MKKIGLGTIISIGMNLFLLFWLLNQYQYDAFFQNYVNTTIGQIYPFIVLTIGVGGGSGLGYLLLKRKHSDRSIVSSLQRTRSFKPAAPVASPSSLQSRNLPAGVAPSAPSKHTVYSVPPLPKSATPSGSRGGPSFSWSTGAKTPSFGAPSASKEPSSNTPPTTPTLRSEPPRSSPTFQSSTPRSESPQISSVPRAQGDTSSRPGTSTSWRPELSGFDRKQDSGPIFQKPGMDTTPRQDISSSGKPGTQTPSSLQSTPLPGSKWQPHEQKPSPGQRTDNFPQSGVPVVPPRWTPPSANPPPQGQGRPPAGLPPRPGSVPPRPPFPPSQGNPRPFVFQGPGRPGAPGPMGVPRPFAPDPNRPPPGMGPQQRPPQPAARPPTSSAGPMPQPWTPPSQSTGKKETPGFLGEEKPSATSESGASKPTLELKGEEVAGGGEMDWDTALDTILKTLRKDRVGDKQ